MIPWLIIGGISMIIFAVVLYLLAIINFITVLFTGSYFEAAHSWTTKLQVWLARSNMYFAGVTNERPGLHPF
jgi:hypothetical protein